MKGCLYIILLSILLVPTSQAFSDEIQIKTFENNVSSALNQITGFEQNLENSYSPSETGKMLSELESTSNLLKASLAGTDARDVSMTRQMIANLVEIQQKYVNIQNLVEDKIANTSIQSKEYVALQNIKNISASSEKNIFEFLSKIYVDESKAKIFPSVDKISLVYYIDEGLTSDAAKRKFSLINATEVQPRNLKVIPTELVNKDEVRFVGSTADSKYNNLETHTDRSGRNIQVSYYLVGDSKEGFKEEGTYVGKLHITGDNFDTISLDVEILVKQNPWNLLGWAFGGMSLAAVVGVGFTFWEKRKETKDKDSDDNEIIDKINARICRWNNVRDVVDANGWAVFSRMVSTQITEIEKRRDKLILDKDDEEVKWFERIDPEFDKRLLDQKQLTANEPIKTILKPDYDDDEELKKLTPEQKKELKKINSARKKSKVAQLQKKIKDDLGNAKKIFYIISVGLISVPTSVFAVDSFVGLREINYLISFATGFGIYRIQDIRNAFFQKP